MDLRALIEDFHKAYFDAAGVDERDGPTWKTIDWLGVRVQKPPGDLIVYQQLIHRIRPRWIIETGTKFGGSALFFASICDLIGYGEVLTIDTVAQPDRPTHPRIIYVPGNSTDPTVVTIVSDVVQSDAGPVFVSLDSDHHAPHVTAELDAYAPLVTPGSYLVVEDTQLNGHPVDAWWGPGPAEALAAWLPEHPEFVVDPACEAHWVTWNPGGWLRRQA